MAVNERRHSQKSNVAVDKLNDGEAEALAAQRPELRALLFGAAGVQEIARRPFFAAVLVDHAAAMGLDPEAPPQTESELIEACLICRRGRLA